MPFDRQHNLVFLHIPKTAGTSIEKMLNLWGQWDEENLETCFGLIQSRDLLALNLSSNYLQHLTLSELETIFPEFLSAATLFTVVRDPWQRLLSSFRNPDQDLSDYYHYRTHQNLSDLSLAEYIDVARWLPHPHLKPQLHFLGDERSDTHNPKVKIFKQEELNELTLWLTKQKNKTTKLMHHNTAKRQMPTLPKKDLLNLEQQVRWLYANDCHAFGYPVEVTRQI